MDNNKREYPILNIFRMKTLRKNTLDSTISTISSSNLLDDDPRRYSVSNKYYDDAIPTVAAVLPDSAFSKEYCIKQSQRIPSWIVACITHSLGIHPQTKPILGTLIHVITYATALIYVVTFVWIRTYDVMSPNTPLDILKASVTILIALIWSSLGMYAKSLTKRLFRHPRLVKDIRMHSRTLFKINAAFLAFILGLIFVITNDMDSLGYMHDHTCELIELPPFVCWMYFVSKLLFSAFSLLWNTIVATVLISICRTHTIGLRRFIKELEMDALVNDNNNCMHYKECPMTREDVFEETFWLEEEQSLGNEEDSEFLLVHRIPVEKKLSDVTPDSGIVSCKQEELVANEQLVQVSPVATPKRKFSKASSFRNWNKSHRSAEGEGIASINVIAEHDDLETQVEAGAIGDRSFDSGQEQASSSNNEVAASGSSVHEDSVLEMLPEESMSAKRLPQREFPALKNMSSPEILHKYWKISCRLRASSCVFQRWLASLIALVIVWCIVYLLHWQDQPATINDVIQFVVPLMLLPLLCSAFAEVNLEGVRMVKCIFPVEERLPLLRFLQMNPLQMTVFNVNLSYGTIMTVVFAIFVAFTSRLIFTELQKP